VGDTIRLLVARDGDDDECEGASEEIYREFLRRFGVGVEVRWVDARELPFSHRKLIRVYRDEGGDAA